jgi:hypothetical protein
MDDLTALVEARIDWLKGFPEDEREQIRINARHLLESVLPPNVLSPKRSHLVPDVGVRLALGIKDPDPDPSEHDSLVVRIVVRSVFDPTGAAKEVAGKLRRDRVRRRRRLFFNKFQDELHDLLCSEQKYTEERHKLLEEYRAGQASFAAAVTAILSPCLGAGTQLVAAAVAVMLTVIGRVGLKTWCGLQAERRSRLKTREGSSTTEGPR